MAFDVATQTGVAFGVAGKVPRATTYVFGKSMGDHPVRFAKAMRAVSTLMERYEPDHVFFEAPIGGEKANAFLIGLTACITGTVASYGVPVERAPVQSVRKHFLGKHLVKKDFPGMSEAQARGAIKQRVVGRCTALGWTPKNDDESDAMAIWDYGCGRLRVANAMPEGLF